MNERNRPTSAPCSRAIGSQVRGSGKPVVVVEGPECAATLRRLVGDRYDIVQWRDTEVDMAAPVVIADQAKDPLAGLIIGSLGIIGVLMLLAWLWWASHGGKWVAPW